MRHLLALFIIVSSTAFAQITVETSIDKVTLFQSGAQIFRTGNIQVPAGNSSLVFPYLTQSLDPNSIALDGSGNITILSVTHQNNYLSEEDKSKKLQELEAQQKSLQNDIDKLIAQEQALNTEKQMLTANQQIGGNNGVSLNQLQQTSNYVSQRILAINLKLIEYRNEKTDIENEKRKVLKQIQEERQSFASKTGQVIVQIEAKAATKANLKLSYLVHNANWTSIYDARVTDLNEPIALTQKANIIQQTGEDWDNVQLTLSTGVPSSGGQIPQLNTQYVYFAQNFSYQQTVLDGGNRNAINAYAKNSPNIRGARAESDALEEVSFQSFEINQNITQQEYTIDRKQNIKSAAQASVVVLREMDIPAQYEYQVKPRLDHDAFLIARIYDWNKFDLLNGEISLFNGTTYIGKSYLNTQNPDDTLQLSLGRDKGIIVSRLRIRDKQEKNFLGNQKVELYTYKIELRNTKKSAVKIVVKDQIPVSKDADIEVNTENISNGKLDSQSGTVVWKMTLNPTAQKELLLSYTIKYPKDKNINLN